MLSILVGQAILGGLTGAAAWGLAGANAAESAGIGAVVAMANLLHMGWRFKRASSERPLYLGAAERFLFTGLAFAIAVSHLHLLFLPLLAGFACAQFGHLAGARPQCESA
jgi:hypothetical protein